MKEFRSVYQLLIILVSFLILVLVIAVVIQPRFRVLLPLAGLLAGVNAVLNSRVLLRLDPRLRQGLLAGGLATIAFMAVVAIVPTLR